jgi:cell division protein FtsI (penicillin-binding protein 3)
MSAPFLQAQGAQRYEKTIELQANRGRILDRHGVVLASSLPARSVWAYPDRVDLSDPRLMDVARLLDIKPLELQRRLTAEDKNFVFLKRQVDLDTAERIRALRIKGIGQDGEYKRDYPQGEMVAHLVGFTDIGHVGQEGLELAFQSTLAGHVGSRRVMRDGTGQIIGALDQVREPRDGRDLRLTIDTRIQSRTFDALKDAVKESRAKAGAAVVMDAKTGEVLAMANWPSYNPNERSRLAGGDLRNRAITDLFEPGSTLKAFTAALALESGKFRPGSIVDAREGKLTIGRDTIRDAHRARELMTLEQVIQKSSNIGTAKVALSLPAEDHWRLLTAAGFGQASKTGFPGAAAGQSASPQEVEAHRACHDFLWSRHLRLAAADGARLHDIRRQRRTRLVQRLQDRRATWPANAGVDAAARRRGTAGRAGHQAGNRRCRPQDAGDGCRTEGNRPRWPRCRVTGWAARQERQPNSRTDVT